VFLVALVGSTVGCASGPELATSSAPVRTEAPAPSSPVATASVVTAAPFAFPIPIERFVPQTIDPETTRFDALELGGGTSLVILDRALVRFDAQLRRDRTFSQLDPSVVPASLAATNVEPRPLEGDDDIVPWDVDGSSQRFRCDRTFERCVVPRAEEDGSVSVAIHVAGADAPSRRFAITREDLGIPAEAGRVPLRTTRFTRGRAFDGPLVAVLVAGYEPYVCVFDVAQDRRLSCGAFYGQVEGVYVDASSNRVCVVDYHGLVCRDPASIGVAEPDHPPIVAQLGRIHGGFFSGILGGESNDLSIVHLGTGRRWQMPFDPDRWIVYDRDAFAILEASRVRIVQRDGREQTIPLAQPLDVARPQNAAIAGASVYVLDRGLGLVRVRPDDDAAASIGPRAEHGATFARRSASFGFDVVAKNVSFDARGIHVEDVVSPIDSERALEDRLFELTRPYEIELGVARSHDPARDEYVYVQEGALHVVDHVATELRAPIRLPARTNGTVCNHLEYFTDVDVGIAGVAPCVPTRIHLPNGRTSPLGRAYVDAAATPDRARTLLLANRRLLLLDGHTGETLAQLDPPFEHLRGVSISRDGRRGTFHDGENDWVLALDIDAVGDRAPGMRVVPLPESFDGTYLLDDDLLVTCSNGELRFAPREHPAAERVIAASICASGRRAWEITPSAIPGYVAIGRGNRAFVVRLADAATFELEVVAAGGDVAVLVREGDRYVGLFPDDSPIARFRAEDGSLVAASASPDPVDALVRRFFTAP